MREILQDNKEVLTGKFQAVAAARRTMHQIGINANAPLTAADFAAPATLLAQAQAEAAAGLPNLRLQLLSVLTPDQKAKAEAFREQMHQGFHESKGQAKLFDAIINALK